MTQFFEFEADFVESLRCIPMAVRYKLDTCGVKLKLAHWQSFSEAERDRFVQLPCDRKVDIEQYRTALQALVAEKTGAPAKDLTIDPAPPWLQIGQIPDDVLTQAAEYDQIVSLAQWASLTPLQRFALLKLSRPGHENRNFLPALAEFGLKDAS